MAIKPIVALSVAPPIAWPWIVVNTVLAIAGYVIARRRPLRRRRRLDSRLHHHPRRRSSALRRAARVLHHRHAGHEARLRAKGARGTGAGEGRAARRGACVRECRRRRDLRDRLLARTRDSCRCSWASPRWRPPPPTRPHRKSASSSASARFCRCRSAASNAERKGRSRSKERWPESWPDASSPSPARRWPRITSAPASSAAWRSTNRTSSSCSPLCAFLGSYLESILGSWNRRHGSPIANGTLNFANTMFGAFLFWVAWHWVPMFAFQF